jgi:hypothetical protein
LCGKDVQTTVPTGEGQLSWLDSTLG